MKTIKYILFIILTAITTSGARANFGPLEGGIYHKSSDPSAKVRVLVTRNVAGDKTKIRVTDAANSSEYSEFLCGTDSNGFSESVCRRTGGSWTDIDLTITSISTFQTRNAWTLEERSNGGFLPLTSGLYAKDTDKTAKVQVSVARNQDGSKLRIRVTDVANASEYSEFLCGTDSDGFLELRCARQSGSWTDIDLTITSGQSFQTKNSWSLERGGGHGGHLPLRPGQYQKSSDASAKVNVAVEQNPGGDKVRIRVSDPANVNEFSEFICSLDGNGFLSAICQRQSGSWTDIDLTITSPTSFQTRNAWNLARP